MDILIEGKINNKSDFKEILKSAIELKEVFNPILRVNDSDNAIEGRIGFCKGGFILGGEVKNGENGWSGIKKLLEVNKGNYALLKPNEDNIPELNQSLWIKVERLIPVLDNLPASPDMLLVNNDKSAETKVDTKTTDKTKEISLDSIRPDINHAGSAKVAPQDVKSESNQSIDSLRQSYKIDVKGGISSKTMNMFIYAFILIVFLFGLVNFLIKTLAGSDSMTSTTSQQYIVPTQATTNSNTTK